ncbi:unnamed protein product [Linum tenue]|uniref:Fe2OG dioxygenase domain-containing protein n=1 Tax=Linum tenue TaxID=586396 RepID=A0AAV0QY65_9ROSI|nr:unnamed protein product [Linum tenue]
MVGITQSGSGIPVVDLSPFLAAAAEDENMAVEKKKAMEAVKEACSEYGLFQIVNHGVPTALIDRALQLSADFFDLPDGEKRKFTSKPAGGAALPSGYNRRPFHSPEKNEFLLMFHPSSPFNVYPTNPPHLREVMEEVFVWLSKTGWLMEGIINDCLGLPAGFLQQFNSDRKGDFMSIRRYFPAAEDEDRGLTAHQDGNSVTFILQDDAGGLEVLRNGEWIPATPTPGSIIVNIGDVIQVLSNNKFKSSMHRVVRPKGRSRYSFAFFYCLPAEKWVEPLPEFTEKVGELPKYRKFQFKEYTQLRMRDVMDPPQRPEDSVTITHYSIN